MNTSTEIRKLPPSCVRELVQMLDYNDSWKKLMDSIPKILEKDNYECKVTRNNLRKYRSEHFKLIENASKTSGRACTEILFDEWGTSGRVRPALGHLLFLLTSIELFRAADYVATQLLSKDTPTRPSEGPAAHVTIILPQTPDPELQEIERILDAMDYPSSVISNLNNSSCNVNLNMSNADGAVQVIPRIVVSEIPNSNQNSSLMMPIVSETRKKRMVRQKTSFVEESTNSVSDMIKFSETQSCELSNAVPNISDLMSSDSDNQSSTQNDSFNSLPALSVLNADSAVAFPTEQNVPALSDLLSEKIPSISGLLDNSLENIEDQMPNLSIFNVEEQSDFLPQMSILISKSSTGLPSESLNNTTQENSFPQFSALLCDKSENDSSSTNHFLPISDHTSDIPSETSSLDSKNSNASSGTSQRSNSRNTCVSPLPNLSLNTLLPHFTYSEIEAATNNFDETPHKNCRQVENPLAKTNGRFLGSGAFGSVFLGLGIVDKPLAVKKLFLDDVDVVNVDDTVTKQFRNEVEVLSKYKHENLLSLVGYSCDGPTYCLLYEFIPGGALKDRLQSLDDKLFWTNRLYIALGTARAVSYLHTAYSVPLIHRDIKTANILLDCSNKPKLCDFGLIKLISNQNANTNTSAFGTSAYMAREAFCGDVSVKLDSFSFGVVLLELITSLPPLDENREGLDIITHVEEVCEGSAGIDLLIDTKAGSWIAKDINFANELYHISKKCLEENKKRRPTMVEVTEELSELIKRCV